MKQIIQMEENKDKNPKWWKANLLSIVQTRPNNYLNTGMLETNQGSGKGKT